MGKTISMANFEGRQEEDDTTCTEQVEKFRAAVRYLKMSMELQLEHNGYFCDYPSCEICSVGGSRIQRRTSVDVV